MNKSSTSYIFLFITIISVVFGTGVSLVHYSTQALLAENESLFRNRRIVEAFGIEPEATSPDAYRQAVENSLTQQTLHAQNRTFTWFMTTAPDRPSFIGVIVSGMGFWDRIRAIVVLSPDLSTIQGIRFLEQHETPGLGARIEEAEFTGQFIDLAVNWNAANGEYIELSSPSDRDKTNAVDGITGATQTSMALIYFLNRELRVFRNALIEEQSRG